jgi:galactonate dehydratase
VRIGDLRVIVVGNPWKNWVLVALDTDAGLTGYGEATLGVSTRPVVGALEELRPLVIGEEATGVAALWERMSRAWNLPTDPVHVAAMSAVEIACWDLIGKSVDQPIHVLLGGAARDRIPVYANGWYPADRSPDAYADRATKTVGAGYRALKFDPFSDALGTLSRSDERLAQSIVAAVRESVGPDVDLLIEAHDRFDIGTARAIARWLEPYRITWLEAPVFSEDTRRLGQVSKTSPVPIAAGERLTQPFQFDDLWRRGRVGIWQPETLAVGGVSGMRRIAALAATHGASLAPHNARGPVCTAVNVELAAWLPNLLILETFVAESIPLAREIAPGLPEIVDGYVRPTMRPGIGIEINEEAAIAHPFDPKGVLRLFESGWESRRGVRSSPTTE